MYYTRTYFLKNFLVYISTKGNYEGYQLDTYDGVPYILKKKNIYPNKFYIITS